MEKTVAIVQARMGSSRLPGKSLLDIAGKPMLQHVLERLARASRVQEVVVATTTAEADAPILLLAESLGVPAVAGSEHDVLARYIQTAQAVRADIIVRITADCPLVDPELVDQVIAAFHREKADYASNVLDRSFPRGVDTEVFSFDTLGRVNERAQLPFEREHVTPYFYLHPDEFTLASVTARGILARPDLRLCVDAAEDLHLVREIYARLGGISNTFSVRDVVALLESEPALAELNRHVEQKKLAE